MQNRSHIPDHHLLQRFHRGIETGTDQKLFELGELFEVGSIQCINLCLYLLNRCSSLQTSDVVPIVVVMNSLLLVREGCWNPHPHFRVDEDKVRRHHSHDSERAPVQSYFASERRRIAAEDLLPQPITQDYFLLGPDLSLLGAKRPAEEWFHSEQVEERRCGRHRHLPLRRAIDVDGFVGEAES